MQSMEAVQVRAKRTVAHIVALGLGLAAIACISPSDPLSHLTALEEAQKRYTEAIRWGDIERAARYVDSELREEFLSLAEAFEGVHISDYEIGDLDLESDEKRRAEVEVTYLGYAPPYYVERKIRERQVWVRDDALGDRWRVQPALAPLIAALGGK